MDNKDNLRDGLFYQASITSTETEKERKLRERLENTLTDNMDGIRNVAESMPVPVTISRVSDNSVLYANVHFRQLLGLVSDQLVGAKTSVVCCSPPNHQYRLRDAIKRDGYLHDEVVYLKKTDGTFVRSIALGLPVRLRSRNSLLVCLHYPVNGQQVVEDIFRDSGIRNTKPAFQSGELTIDFGKRRVFLGNREVYLTGTEYRLLACLACYAGSVMTADELLSLVWGDTYLGDRNLVEINIARIRQKLNDNHRSPRYIVTRTGFGYMFAAPAEASQV